MLQIIFCIILATCACFQISVGQIAYTMQDNPFSSGASSFNSGVLVPGSLQDSGSPATLNKENYFQIRTEPSTSFFQAPFPSGPFSAIRSTDQTFPLSNPPPVESFITEFNSAVYTSKTLTDIFDLRDLSAEAISKSLYDYVYARSFDFAHSNPHYVASVVATPVKEGIDTYTLPVMLNIFGNSVAKYLFAKGILNSSNASSLARNYAKAFEESAKHNMSREFPETKLFPLDEGFAEFFKSIDQFSVDTIEDLAIYFANEVKSVSKKL